MEDRFSNEQVNKILNDECVLSSASIYWLVVKIESRKVINFDLSYYVLKTKVDM